jgi:hypothetical protein
MHEPAGMVEAERRSLLGQTDSVYMGGKSVRAATELDLRIVIRRAAP